MIRHRTTALVLAGCVAVVAIVAVGMSMGWPGGQAAPAAPSSSPSATAPTTLATADIYQTILPSLVVIRTNVPENDDADDSGQGLGAGVVIDASGTILTAYHVIGEAQTIDVEFADGTTSPAFIAVANPDNDTATLSTDTLPEVVVPAVLGGGVAVGDRVVAVGNPLGLIATTTEGVVSGLDRSIDDDEFVVLSGLIQFDAAVNPGSSGGPLLNDRGQVVGIVSSIADPSEDGFFIGIGFAVPIGAALGSAVDGQGAER